MAAPTLLIGSLSRYGYPDGIHRNVTHGRVVPMYREYRYFVVLGEQTWGAATWRDAVAWWSTIRPCPPPPPSSAAP